MRNLLSSNKHQIAIVFCIAWIILNLFQAAQTELTADEAYYWVYAQDLDWGYYEQPPVTAFVIWLGTKLVGGEFGVRWLFVLLSAIGLYANWRLTEPEDQQLYFTLFLAIGITHVGAFLAVPDIPLIFTSGLFYLAYKHYLKKDSWLTAIGLGLIVAAMSYSKYHAVVVLMSALAGAWYLIKRPSFWLIPLIATLLYIPHLHWQVINDYPPIRYHMIDRQAEAWTPMFAINYLLGQLIVFGPLIGFILFPAALKYRPKDSFSHAMRYCAFGITGFFLLLSLKGRVEANWTASAIGPLLYLAYYYIAPRPEWRKWTFRIAWPSLVLIGVFRLYMMLDVLPHNFLPRNEFHGWQTWAERIQEVAEDRPVIFFNNYQKTSRYRFYSHQAAHSQSLVSYAGDQYDLLTANEENMQGNAAMLIDNWNPGQDIIQLDNGQQINYQLVPAYYSFNRVHIATEQQEYRFAPDSLVTINIQITNPTDKVIRFDQAREKGLRLKWFTFLLKQPISSGTAMENIPIDQLEPGASIQLQVPLRTPKEPGQYRFRFCVEWWRYPGRNGNFTRMIIE